MVTNSISSLPDPASSGQTGSSGSKDITQTFDFSPTTYEALEKLANGRTIGETLREAIAISKWFHDTIRTNKILVERDGKLYQVVKI